MSKIASKNELLANLRVLVVDDDPDVRALMGLVLHRSGAAVMLASGVEMALEALKVFEPQVVLTDIRMGDCDDAGYRLLRAIRRSKRPHVRTIAVSGCYNDRVTGSDLEHGFDGYLVKPVPLDSLIDAVGNARNATTDKHRCEA